MHAYGQAEKLLLLLQQTILPGETSNGRQYNHQSVEVWANSSECESKYVQWWKTSSFKPKNELRTSVRSTLKRKKEKPTRGQTTSNV